MSHLILFLISGGCCTIVQAADYVNAAKRYALQYNSDWTKVEYPTPVDLALACDVTVCGDNVRFTSNANFVPQAAALTTSEFLSSAPAGLLTQTVRQIVDGLGSVQVLSAPKIAAVGDRQGYVGSYLLAYNDGPKRSLLYAVTFDRGYMYHLQFYEPADASGGTTVNATRFYRIIETFRLTR